MKLQSYSVYILYKFLCVALFCCFVRYGMPFCTDI